MEFWRRTGVVFARYVTIMNGESIIASRQFQIYRYTVISMVQSPRESQKKIEALRDSEARFRATFENAAVGIARVAPDGSWLEVNQRLCDIVGYAREELMTKTFGDITHPDDLEQDLIAMRRISAGEIDTFSMEKRYCRKDG